jgi:hypothetical protein
MSSRRTNVQYQWVPVQVSTPRSSLEAAIRAPASGLRAAAAPATPVGTARPLSLGRALAEVGLPQSNLSPEDELVDLLLNASEVEHGLLVQYLYAAYSSNNPVVSGLVREIAIEEMGHFLTVQNLLLACGQQPYLAAGDWLDSNRFHPFPFTLQAVSRQSLGKYTTGEMPDLDSPSISADQRAALPEILADAKISAGEDVQAHRVGLLYMKIYWLLRASDAELGDPSKEPWAGFPVSDLAKTPALAGRHVGGDFLQDQSAREGLSRHWRGSHLNMIVATITGRSDALQAIADVSAQGEGFGLTTDGHFQRLVVAWQQAKSVGGPIAVKVATDPWYAPKSMARRAGGSEITHPLGLAFAKVADGVYQLCLLSIALYLALPSSASADIRRKAARAAISCMKDGLAIAAMNLRDVAVRLGDSTAPMCGLPFSMAPDLPAEPAALLDRAATVKAAIVAEAGKIDSAAGASADQIDAANSIAQAVETVLQQLRSTVPGS